MGNMEAYSKRVHLCKPHSDAKRRIWAKWMLQGLYSRLDYETMKPMIMLSFLDHFNAGTTLPSWIANG